MKEAYGNLWGPWCDGAYLCITTNGFVKQNGECVMGRGIAKQAASRFPHLPFVIGQHVKLDGNVPVLLSKERLITLPVKHKWWEKADVNLIVSSLTMLVTIADCLPRGSRIVLPRPGCGNGQLDWANVRPIILPMLDDRFTVVEWVTK